LGAKIIPSKWRKEINPVKAVSYLSLPVKKMRGRIKDTAAKE